MFVAMLGVGRLGAFHARVLAGMREVRELRIHDADVARAADLARELGARATSLDDALAGADAAVIVTPTGTHADLLHRCLDAGIAAFCEKPISLDLASSRLVVEHAARSGGRVQIGFQRRFDAGFRAARERVRAGALGTVYAFAMTSRDATPPPDAYVETSGGQFRDQMIHDLDVTRWLFGDVEEIFAAGSSLGSPQYERFGDVATSVAVVRTRDGAMGAISAARHNEAGYDIRVEIYGGRDTIAVGWDERTPVRSVEPAARPLAGPAYASFFERFDAAYRAELAHFLRYARGEERDPVCTAVDAHEALRIAEAATISLRERRPVRVAEVPA